MEFMGALQVRAVRAFRVLVVVLLLIAVLVMVAVVVLVLIHSLVVAVVSIMVLVVVVIILRWNLFIRGVKILRLEIRQHQQLFRWDWD